MLRFWLNRDLPEGLHTFNVYKGVEIVEVSYEENGERRIEPGPSPNDIEAMQRYIQVQFPSGWRIMNGEIQEFEN